MSKTLQFNMRLFSSGSSVSCTELVMMKQQIFQLQRS